MPGRDFKNEASPSSMARAIAENGLLRALTAARGPMPDTVMNASKILFQFR